MPTWEEKSNEGIALFKKGNFIVAETAKLAQAALGVAESGDAAATEEANNVVARFHFDAMNVFIEAADALDKALELMTADHPRRKSVEKNAAVVYNAAATELFVLGEFKEAIGVLRQATELDTTNAPVQRNLAKALAKEGARLYEEGAATESVESVESVAKLKSAIDCLEEALVLTKSVEWVAEPKDVVIAKVTQSLCTTYNNLAVGMDAHGFEVTETLPLLVKAANLGVDDAAIKNIAGILNNHSLSMADQGLWAQALEMIHQACSLNPDEKAVWDNCKEIVDAAHGAGHDVLAGQDVHHHTDDSSF